ncbi:hypothetical protein [Geoalkalibacter sp.]|uniref:hypothetical protein n=1 Tax=Geoalkalibacter sp. TaxID=3041440 RepID=UPI00272E3F13|nr:hypothetical protein [Geoalkalibacter sp.]
MAIDWRWEAEMSRARRQLEEAKSRYFGEGLSAADGQCPYPPTSFAAIHWRRGAEQRSQG